jgi:EAL domain-containing protein (putative c-di-GMP-specific phosphodiesterase class I)
MLALQEMGADHLQGYLLSRPLDAGTLSSWAHQHAADQATSDEPRTSLAS